MCVDVAAAHCAWAWLSRHASGPPALFKPQGNSRERPSGCQLLCRRPLLFCLPSRNFFCSSFKAWYDARAAPRPRNARGLVKSTNSRPTLSVPVRNPFLTFRAAPFGVLMAVAMARGFATRSPLIIATNVSSCRLGKRLKARSEAEPRH